MKNLEPIPIKLRHSVISREEFHCSITDRLDEFRIDKIFEDSDFKDVMRTYMMIPEEHSGHWFIPIRVPGATRGHIEVTPSNGYWKVVEVKLYEETSIYPRSNIGCYKPEVKNILSEFIGINIDLKEYNPGDN